MSKLVLAIFGDGHSNSTVGLRPPRIQLDDGDESYPSRAQRWLWDCWLDYCQQARKAARNGRLYAISNGDALDVDSKKRSNQIISRNEADIIKIASAAYEPLLEHAEKVWWIRGTSAHVGKSAAYEELLAKDYTNTVKCTDTDTYSWWDFQAEWQGIGFDILHHTSGDARPWTYGASMVRLANETILEYFGRGERPPQFVIRSHQHRYRDSGDMVKGCRAITLPAFSLATEYVSRLGKRQLADVGGAIVTIENGEADVRVVQYPAQKRAVWREKE